MLALAWLLFINTFQFTHSKIVHKLITPLLKGDDLKSATIILNTTADLISDSNQRVAALYIIKLDNLRSAPFEVGYLVHTMQEKYRKMVDKYNTSHFMNTKLYVMELVMYLEEIEHHYWEIEHLSNMLHEIERKYKIFGGLQEDYRDHTMSSRRPVITPPPDPYMTKKKKATRIKMGDMLWKIWSTTRRRQRGKFPLDYGWDVANLP